MSETNKYYPSKLMLFGEYGVLHGLNAIALPYSKFSGKFIFTSSGTDNSLLNLANYLTKIESSFHYRLDLLLFKQNIQQGLIFESNIPRDYGLGSSGALVAAIFDNYRFDKSNIDTLSLNKIKTDLAVIESFFHGKSSGTDPLVSLIQKPVLVEKKKITLIEIPMLSDEESGFFLIDSKVKGKTAELVLDFITKMENATFVKKFKTAYRAYSNEAVNSFLTSNKYELLKSMIGLSAFQIEQMADLIPIPVQKYFAMGINTEKFALKICGSGGGGFFLGYTCHKNYVKQVFREAIFI